jgi:EAL domain-containing protein (putative c-di-GMP-specific phosphodiesterase class I)
MRINLNNPDIMALVSSLCNDRQLSPTQLIINLINSEYIDNLERAQTGCSHNEEKERIESRS